MTSLIDGHADLLAFISNKFAERERFTVSDLRALCRSPGNSQLVSALTSILHTPEGRARVSDVQGISATNPVAIGRLLYLYRDTIKGGKRLEIVNGDREVWIWVSVPYDPQVFIRHVKAQ